MLMGLEDTVQSFTAVGGILLGFLCMIPEIIIWSRKQKIFNNNQNLNLFLLKDNIIRFAPKIG